MALELAATLSAFPQLCLRSDRRSALEQWGLPLDAALGNEIEHGMGPILAGEVAAGARRFADGAGRHGEGV